MDKYDEHGFYTREWAEENIPGFRDLGPCCQQEVLLFPDVPVPCITPELDIPKPELPEWIVIGPPKLTSTQYVPVSSHWSEGPKSVDTGGPFWPMVSVLILMVIFHFVGRGKR